MEAMRKGLAPLICFAYNKKNRSERPEAKENGYENHWLDRRDELGELGLIIQPEDSPVPIFDTTVIHARRAVELALES